ncbi:hypothetical protein K505DRAFT_258941 [Melanomma pulvis-pyrius CBS 109.77]|uniref:Fungal N-terminal domain-containing protein n=1 Tax=Melanomma pulvis-pyrius CBS 109.77 TaxID=1314802 RepID=A0A6A6WSH7_9PLEO|nr:hypothetical protein K505DRAFT_258941 [Melanomma pulvis-pyrius CBS 109.77]
MESLTALGLAANIIQFVEFSARLLSEASEVYHSTTGLSKDQVELQDVAESLKNMTESLLEINKIALSAKVVAEDLITAVQRLKVTEGSKKRWRSFRQALSTLWNKDKIENLQKRLDALRSQLSVQILAHVRYSYLSHLLPPDITQSLWLTSDLVRSRTI